METLQELKDYASTTDNVWLQKKLEILDREITIEKHKVKIETYDTCINMI